MRFPAPLRPRDLVAVVAPASPFDRTLALRGIGWLAERYRVAWDWRLFTRSGFLAGSDDRRAEELNRALASGARAVVAARGGHGALRIADRVAWDRIDSPPFIVGFSDMTALHVEAARVGIASLHGPMVCSLGRGDAMARDRFMLALEDPFRRRTWKDLSFWTRGSATGPLFGGNLTVLQACAAAGRLEVPPSAILVLEDVTERPYRIDRALTSLIVGGHLAKVSGVVLGEFTDCDTGPDGVSVTDVLRERLGHLGVPVATGLPLGHGKHNDPILLGGSATLNAAHRTLETDSA